MALDLNFLLKRLFRTSVAVMLILSAGISAGAAQTPDVPSLDEQPASVQRFIGLMSDPDVQKWLQRVADGAKPDAVVTTTQVTAPPLAASTMRFRAHAAAMVDAAHSFPSEAMRGGALLERDIEAIGGTRPIILLAAFVTAGLLAQWLFWWISAGWRSWMAGASLTSVRQRIVSITGRLLWAAFYVLSFGLGSIGFFLLFDWPPLVREIVVGFLFAVVAFRLANAFLDVLLAPGSDGQGRFRVVPITDEAAGHWAKRLSYLVGWYGFGWVMIRLLGTIGFSIPTRQLAAYCLGLILLGIAVESVWRRPRDASTMQASRIGLHGRNWLWTAYFVGVWILWVAGAMKLFWIVVVCAALPGAVALTKASITNILRHSVAEEDGQDRVTVLSVVVERGIRAGLIVAAIIFLADVLDVPLTEMTMQDSPALRLVRGVLSAGIILLVVDLAWNVVKVLIDRKMGDTEAALEIGSERERRRTRLRTLLPILRNFVMILFAAIAIMMALSSLGIEIGPLIAGAGVVGVAIGFGAQTVVKDIISGMFYLLDDAFRIGEYIQSGSYKGTVEAFSLRSVKLRHHRGPIFIVPFSELGAIQNMSRDWSVVKFLLSVSNESDVAQVKAITKTVGKALRDDPEFQPFIIENLKMKGVEEITDIGIKLSFGMTLKPTQLQSAIRRRAYAMLREAFNAQGIRIAVPTVQVAGGKDDGLAAVAQQALAKQNAVAAAGPA